MRDRIPVPNVLGAAVALLLVFNYLGPFNDLDFAWQARTGEQILDTGRLRPVEVFSYTIGGGLIPDFEWLYEVILWVAYTHLGFGGLKLLKTVLVFTPLALLYRNLRREAVPWPGVALALGVAVVVLVPVWNLRPLYVTTIGLLLLTGLLRDHCAGRRPLPVWLPVVMLLWANLHPGVLFGQVILASAILWEWLNRRWQINPPLDRAAAWRLTWIGGLGLAATFLSPDPIERMLYPFHGEVWHPVQRLFTEIRPLHTFLLTPPYATNLTLVVFALVLVTVVFRFRQYRLWELGLLAGMTWLAFRSVRSMMDWLLLMLALGVPHLTALLRQWLWAWRRKPAGAALRSFNRGLRGALNGPTLRPHWFWPAATCAVLIVLSLIPPVARRMPVQEGETWPTAAVAWVEANGVRGRFFSPPDYGSYLIWRLGATSQAYVDTRGYFFPPEVIEDGHYLPLMSSGWEGRLERVLARGTDYFLLEATGPRGELWRRLEPHVEPLYRDDKAVLLRSDQIRDGLQRSASAALERPSAATVRAGG
jgi:hypothetical protein